MVEKFDVIIVGGGVSGLVCAYHLKKHQPHIRLKILEAKDRLGGRVLGKSIKTINGIENIDLGGQWLGRSQLHVMRLIKEIGLQTYNQFVTGDTVNILGYKKAFLTNGPTSLLSFSLLPMFYDLIRGCKKLDECAQMIDIENPMTCSYSKEWDAMTWESAKRWIFSTQYCHKLVDVGMLTVFGFESCQVSFLFVLLYIRCGGGTVALIDETFAGNAQEYKIKGGMFQLSELLAVAVGNENIQTNSPVANVEQGKGECHLTLANGTSYSCKYTALCIPPHLLSNISFEPALQCQHRKLLECMHMGHLIKFVASYKTPFWKDRNLSGISCHWPCYKEASGHPVHITFDATLASGSPALLGFIGGVNASNNSLSEESDLKKKIIDSLVLFFGNEASETIDLVFQDWFKVPYNGGCPVEFSSPGAISLYGDKQLRMPIGRVHFAGTETATIWRGFIDGAVQSGERASHEILKRLDANHSTVDVIKFQEILLPGVETTFRNLYYVLKGTLLVSITSFTALSVYIGLKLIRQANK